MLMECADPPFAVGTGQLTVGDNDVFTTGYVSDAFILPLPGHGERRGGRTAL